ncbi:hypothetical protein A8B82_15910 [Sulfitobacter sp. EhC04]|uniref:TRAP transporter small permease n=1 Tax=Sulfitobacter sp. EhC04 TaxID=1849168 RepID=UPI0007F40E11|nr:TRAP transporter small permease [Sulfitobacter sp. EhC04]OAN75996.1 hypothetical protein A8B82_15910 [Sulfitobacter sp. EhC04]
MTRKLATIASVLAATALFALMMVTFVDVIGRSVFNRPLTGGSELSEILLAASIFLMLPLVAASEEHIAVDLIDPFRGIFLVRVEKILVTVLGSGLFAIIGWRLWIIGDQAVGYQDTTPSLQIPLAPIMYSISILSFVAALMFFAALRNWNLKETKNPELERILKAEGLDSPTSDEPTSEKPSKTTVEN